MNETKPPFPMDERTRDTIRDVAARLYFITLFALIIDVLYRQLAMGQTSEQFEDLAILVTFNAIVFLVAVFWKGGIPFKRIKPLVLIGLYGMLLAGGVLLGWMLESFDEWVSFWPYLGRIAGVGAILIGLYSLAAWWGNKRIEKLISED